MMAIYRLTLVTEGVSAAGYHDGVCQQVAAQAADQLVGYGGFGLSGPMGRLGAHCAL